MLQAKTTRTARLTAAFVCRIGLLLICCASMCAAQQRPQQPQQPTSRHDQYHDQTQPTGQNQLQHHEDSFPGTISEKHGKFYLQIVHTRTSFELADAREGKRWVNKKVRVTGWLDAEHQILHVTTIAKAP
jgi:hypothetical protein